MLYKTTKRLFRGIYQYKIVLVVPGASLFRTGDMDSTLKQLQKIDLSSNGGSQYNTWNRTRWISTKDELDYALKLQHQLKKLSSTDIDVRVETPWISIYANSRKDIDSIANIDHSRVKYVSVPPVSASLNNTTVIMPKIPFDYRITMGKTTQNYSAFVDWAKNTAKIKLTKSCIRDLSKDRSWGGTYFYVNGDNTLLMAKMHLGGSINKIERVVKA